MDSTQKLFSRDKMQLLGQMSGGKSLNDDVMDLVRQMAMKNLVMMVNYSMLQTYPIDILTKNQVLKTLSTYKHYVPLVATTNQTFQIANEKCKNFKSVDSNRVFEFYKGFQNDCLVLSRQRFAQVLHQVIKASNFDEFRVTKDARLLLQADTERYITTLLKLSVKLMLDSNRDVLDTKDVLLVSKIKETLF